MALGLENIEGLNNLEGFSLGGLPGGTTQILLVIAVFIFFAGIIFAIYSLVRAGKSFNKTIYWFEEVGHKPVPTGIDKAKEIIMPGSNIPILYIKAKNMYLPRPTIQTGKDRYWYFIKNNREIVNFSLANLNDEMKTAGLDFDHTDMRYGLANLKAIIHRNYREKAEPWWRLYKDVISLVILIFMLTIAFWFIASKQGETAQLINQGLTIMAQSCPALSGVAPG